MNDRIFSHTQAGKLDDPARLKWLPPSDVMAALDIHSEMAVVDVGAGTGYFSIPIADWLGASGVVYAVNLQPEMLELLKKKLHHGKKKNLCEIELLQGKADCVPLPDRSADLVLLANLWHELDSPEPTSPVPQVLRRSIAYPMLPCVTCSARRAGGTGQQDHRCIQLPRGRYARSLNQGS